MIMNKSGGSGSKPTFWTTSAGTEITGGYLVDKMTIPEQIAGTPLNTTINLLKTNDLRDLLNYTKKITIPERFTTVQYEVAASHYPKWEELEALGATTISLSNTNNNSYMKRLYFPKWTGTIDRYKSFLSNTTVGHEAVSNTLELNMPKITAFAPGAIGNSSHTVALTVNMPAVTSIAAAVNNSLNYLRYCTGTWVFKSATTLGYFPRPSVEQTLRLPAITTITEPFTYGETYGGMLHLYLGPNATSSYTSWMTAITSYPQLFDIHIPAGASSTKSLLDAGGITYTQDYNYTEDL